MSLDLLAIRRQFPALQHIAGGYLDSASTTQKPQEVIDAVRNSMEQPIGNVHRGQHQETENASQAYEQARKSVQQYIGAQWSDEVIFTKNCTEAINLAMYAWADTMMNKGEAVMLSVAEHHSNIVPWLQLAKNKGIELVWIDVDEVGQLRMDQVDNAFHQKKVRFCAFTGQSNVLGTRFPLKEIIAKAHAAGARVLVDAAQLVAHSAINVQELECDFLAFSGHKIYGPTGIAVLYATREMQKEMTPWISGGGAVQEVTRTGFTPSEPPSCFEAGTPALSEAIGLAAAIEWQKQYSWDDRAAHDHALIKTAFDALSTIPSIHFLSPNDASFVHGCVSFTINSIHPHDLTDILGNKGFALRAGHHCAQPLHDSRSISASIRLSTALYTTPEEIVRCVESMKEAIQKLS